MYYRFISDEELHALQRGETVSARQYDGKIHCLPETIVGLILPEELNYKVDISEFDDLEAKYRSVEIPLSEVQFLMSGIISEDHLIILDDIDVISKHLGWYYWNEDDHGNIEECALVEVLIEPYSMKNVTRIVF